VSLKSTTHFLNQARELATTFLLTNQLQRKSCIDRQTKNSRCVALPYRTLRPLIQRAQPRSIARWWRSCGTSVQVPRICAQHSTGEVLSAADQISLSQRTQHAYFRLKGVQASATLTCSVGPTLGSGAVWEWYLSW